MIVSEQWRKTQDGSGNQLYTTCIVNGEQPNAWLLSKAITVPRTVEKVDVTIEFNTRNCTIIGGDNFLKNISTSTFISL